MLNLLLSVWKEVSRLHSLFFTFAAHLRRLCEVLPTAPFWCASTLRTSKRTFLWPELSASSTIIWWRWVSFRARLSLTNKMPTDRQLQVSHSPLTSNFLLPRGWKLDCGRAAH